MSGPILRLEGLPFRINEEEIRQFFTEAECKINRVHLIVNRDLRPSGNGYLEVESEADVKAALTLDGKCVGDSKRYVKIVRTDNEELQWQLRRQELHKGNDTTSRYYCVRLYGVPYKVGEYEIAKWFQPNADCIDVTVHLNHESRPSGDASAYFVSEEVAKKALEKDKADMNGRYINLAMDNVSVSFSNASGSKNAVRLSGLPFRATEQEIKDFFLPINCASVRVILNREGRPSGDAIAEFETDDDVEEAMKKNREHLGSRFVVLTREKDHQTKDDRHGGGRRNWGFRSGEYRNVFSVKMAGIPYRATVDDIVNFFLPELNCVGVRILKNRENKPSGEAIVDFATEEEAMFSLSKNRFYLGDRFVILTPHLSYGYE